MRLWMAWSTFAFVPFLIFMLAAGMSCGAPDTAGPSVDIHNNTAPVVVNVSNGSSSPNSTAPCGATSSQKGSVGTGGPDCSTQANGNNNTPVGPEVVIP